MPRENQSNNHQTHKQITGNKTLYYAIPVICMELITTGQEKLTKSQTLINVKLTSGLLVNVITIDSRNFIV